MKSKKIYVTISTIIIILLMFSVLSFSIAGNITGFADIKDHWGESIIKQLANDGILKGYDDNTFRPNGFVTRAEYCTMLMRQLIKTTDYNSGENRGTFSDVKNGDWFCEYVETAYEMRIVKGKSANVFDPDGEIQRQEMAIMLVNVYCIVNDLNISDLLNSEFSQSGLKDLNMIASWAVDYVKASINAKILKGDGVNFNPENKLTRAEAAQSIYNVFYNESGELPSDELPSGESSLPKTYKSYEEFNADVLRAKETYSQTNVHTEDRLEEINEYPDFENASDEWELEAISVNKYYVIIEYITKEETAYGYMSIKWDRNDYGESFGFLDWALSTFPNYKKINVETKNGIKTVVKGEVYNGEPTIQAYAYFWIENEKMLTAHCPQWYVDKYSDTIILEIMERKILEE